MTTATFYYADPATVTASPWAKVDTDVSSFGRTAVTRPALDIRTAAANGRSFGVDTSGFALLDAPLATTVDYSDDAAVRTVYYAAVERLLRAVLPQAAQSGQPVARVVIFDHTIRRRDPTAPRQPVQQIHIDQTPAAAATRARRHLAAAGVEDAEIARLLQTRYQIINVWRPIGHAATDTPLALVDWRTTDPADAVPVRLLYPDGQADTGGEVLPDAARAQSTAGYTVRGETYTVVPNARHVFYYAKDMTPAEVLLIKCFDTSSAAAGGAAARGRPAVAAWTPHTAFDDPATPEGTPGRESIEVRCLVFYDGRCLIEMLSQQ